MSSLKNTIDSLAAEFASKLITAIKGASLHEIVSATGGAVPARRGRPPSVATPVATASARRKGKGGRRLRRSPADLIKVKANIVTLLAKHPKGLRSEQIRAQLGLSAQEMPRPISEALAEKLITKKGQKRGTTYFKGK